VKNKSGPVGSSQWSRYLDATVENGRLRLDYRLLSPYGSLRPEDERPGAAPQAVSFRVRRLQRADAPRADDKTETIGGQTLVVTEDDVVAAEVLSSEPWVWRFELEVAGGAGLVAVTFLYGGKAQLDDLIDVGVPTSGESA
jgi:hypothetical protein